MDQIASTITGHFVSKMLDYVGLRFKTDVIERWSRHRGRQFFEEFCREVQNELRGEQSNMLDALLSKLLEDGTRSEVLFDAYRHVSLAKSKTLGPRIIGILTARLVVAGRTANDAEDTILSAAEHLADDELQAFADFVRLQRNRAEDDAKTDAAFTSDGDLEIEWYKEQFESNFRRDRARFSCTA